MVQKDTSGYDDCDGWHDFEMWYYLAPMLFLIVAFSFIHTRKRLCLKCLWGRPSVMFPVNFIDEHNRRWAYAAVFGILSYETLDLFEGNMFWNPDINISFPFLRVFVKMVNALILTCIFYPILVCIHQRRHLIMNFIGLAITIFFLLITFWSIRICDPTLTIDGRVQQIMLIPVYICYAAIIICFIYDAGRNVLKLYKIRKGTYVPKELRKSRNIKYMEALLERTVKEKPKSKFKRFKDKFRYEKITGLKYSPRVVCTMTVAMFILFKISVRTGYRIDDVLSMAEALARSEADGNVSAIIPLEIPGFPTIEFRLLEWVLAARYSFICSNTLTCILMTVFVAHMIATYRKHFRKVVRGDHHWHFEMRKKPPSILLSGMKYSGYQIAFILYGYFICLALTTLVLFLIAILVVVPIKYRKANILFNYLKTHWATILMGFVILYSQKLMTKFAFLQERGKLLALNNRRSYHCACFFYFFFNIIVGLFSCLKRVVISLVLGTFLLPRLDHCLFMRGFERFDSGHMAYMGMLWVDVYHNHPLMKAAVEIMQERVRKTSFKAHHDQGEGKPPDDAEEALKLNEEEEKKLLRKKLARNRWWKLVTLLNNPIVVFDMKHNEARDKLRKGHKVTVMDMIANRMEELDDVGAAMV